MIKVSVILPVYGVATYIEKCVQSLLNQTLQEMEFLFVDDHGPDNSIELLRQTIKGHPREKQFRILTPEHNLGAGMARNYAIPEAKGEYIAFVDSDDWIEPDMFETLYKEAIKQNNADLCYSQEYKDFEDHSAETSILRNPIVEPGEFTYEKKAFFLTHYVSYFTTFIFKRSLIEQHSVRFPEDRSADDSFFLACALMTAESIARVDRPFYHYLIRPRSVTTTKDSVKYKKRLTVFSKLMAYAKEQRVYDGLKQELDFLYIKKGYISSLVNYVTNALEPRKEVFEEIYQALLAEVPDYKKNIYLEGSKAIQMVIYLCIFCPKLAIPMLRFYAKRNNIVS